MRKGVLVLLALLVAGAATAQEDAVAIVHEAGAGAPAPAAPLKLPSRESFRLFQELVPDPRVSMSGTAEQHRLLHQQGDPDSLFTIGGPTPGGELHVKAAIEVNEAFLKLVPPDPNVQPNDTRPRAAGSFMPFDAQGRPYQLRLGARLVW
ncbi:MAG TPA: hypothetical protein VMV60_08995 [Thermoanaerobaculia bacterium]|nr:hypothetical protein [Thermoanaerobaculia bacterium]